MIADAEPCRCIGFLRERISIDPRPREDDRLVRDFYLFQVKSRAESKGEWDLMKPIEKLTGDEAFRPLCTFTVSLSR